ncbi:MAG: type transport system permease protein [Acidimicrobiaceae bacterium]|nr:type transport system permease protein [Acidimicrobiaceae bacterium]
MIRLIGAELRRACARRLVRWTIVLAVLTVVVIGVVSFFNTASLSESAYQQRVRDAEARQVAERAQVTACVRSHGVGPGDVKIPDDVARDCFPDGRIRAADPRFYKRTLKGGVSGMLGVLVVVGWALGASLVGAEFPSRSMTTMLTWEPRRGRLFAAKVVATLAVVAALTVAVAVAVVVVMLPAYAMHGGPHRANDPTTASIVGLMARGTLVCALASGIGLAIATIGRNTAAALGAGFAYIIVLENIVGSTLPRYRRWLLLGNVIVFLTGKDGGGEVLGRTVTTAGLFLVGATATLLLGAAASFRTRDIA